jgi:hypothetical protein
MQAEIGAALNLTEGQLHKVLDGLFAEGMPKRKRRCMTDEQVRAEPCVTAGRPPCRAVDSAPSVELGSAQQRKRPSSNPVSRGDLAQSLARCDRLGGAPTGLRSLVVNTDRDRVERTPSTSATPARDALVERIEAGVIEVVTKRMRLPRISRASLRTDLISASSSRSGFLLVIVFGPRQAAVNLAAHSSMISIEGLVGALGPHLLATSDRISARPGYRRDDEISGGR